MTRPNRARVQRLSSLALVALVALTSSCGDVEPCGVPGVTETCACGGGMQGARVCAATHTWDACNCSGSIGLPNPVLAPGETGGMSGGQGGMSSGQGGAGVGGSPMSGTTGGSQPPLDGGGPDDDSGVDPMSGGSGGMTGGSGGMTGGSGGDDGGVVDPNMAYLGCASTADCQPNAECVITPGFPTSASFCAPACIETSDCPVPDGTYEAKPTCVTGYCKIDCTPVLFAPLLTCPPGMGCVAPIGGLSYCHDDGV